MIGIDTNILVRLHVKDHPDQFQKAKQIIDSCSVEEPLFISTIVLVEWYWVLSNSYGVPDEKILEELEVYLNAGDVVVESQEACRAAFKQYKNSSADFADCLIGALNKEHACQTTYTFDRKASRLSEFTLA